MPPVPTASKVNPAEPFCIAPIAPWSCTCGDLASGYIEIKEAGRPGLCTVTVPLASHEMDGYSIDLPDDWFCRIAGAGANNLSCVTEHKQRMFIQSLISELPLEFADEAGHQEYVDGDQLVLYPVVEPEEKKLSREIKIVGEKQVLRLLTQQQDEFLLRYLIKSDDNLYVLHVGSTQRVETENMSGFLEEIIASMQFLP